MTKALASTRSEVRSLEDILAVSPVLPGEDPEDFEALLAATLDHLAPRNHLSRMIGRNIAEVDWERLQKQAMLREYLKNQMAAILNGQRLYDAYELANDLAGARTDRIAAEARLKELGTSSVALMTEIYSKDLDCISKIEQSVHQTEKRRSQLFTEFCRVNTMGSDTVPEAEIVDETSERQ